MPRARLRTSCFAACLVVLLADCSAGPTATSTRSDPSSSTGLDDSETPADSNLPPAFQGIIPDDIFTAPADPLTVIASPDVEHAVTQSIGAAGGEISANGADGSKYTLTIPEGALPFEFAITVSPVAGLQGLDDLGADRKLGVLLAPDGLELATPATLTIQPPSALPPAELGAITFEGSGQETELAVFDQSEAAITMSIPHFSGWVVMSPFSIDAIRPTLRNQFYTQTQIEARLRSEIAAMLGQIRQEQMLGVEPSMTMIEVARSALGAFKRLVVSPRVAIADRGCHEANDAITMYLEYQRQRQLLGVGDDPEFDLVGAGLFVPDALIDLAVQVCFKEAYEHCKATGEFPQLAVYYLSFFRTVGILDAEPAPEHIQLAQGYLGRCGRWRVKVATTIIDDNPAADWYDHHEATREFFAQWKAGDGLFGIIGSTVEGHGPIETTKLDRTPQVCRTVVSDLASVADAAAKITKVTFEPFQGPLDGPNAPAAVPKELSLTVGLGEVDYTFTCPPYGAIEDIKERFDYSNMLALEADGIEPGLDFYQSLSEGTATATFNKGWRFSTGPFKATLVQENTFYPAEPERAWSIYARNEVTVEHEPL